MGAGGQTVGVKYEHRNLVRVLHNALQEAGACAGYALDAEAAGDNRLAGFFREVQELHAKVAGRTGEMLGIGSDDEPRLAGVQTNAAPSEGDPGDVSAGQDVAQLVRSFSRSVFQSFSKGAWAATSVRRRRVFEGRRFGAGLLSRGPDAENPAVADGPID